MAVYAVATSNTELNQKTLNWGQTQERRRLEQLHALLITELGVVVTDQDGAYTKTTTFPAAILTLIRDGVDNVYKSKVLQEFYGFINTELTAVAAEADVADYTVTAGFVRSLRKIASNMPNLEAKIALNDIADLMFIEFTAIAAVA